MQGNFAPVDEIGKITEILDIAGEIPTNFPEGVYIRNGNLSKAPAILIETSQSCSRIRWPACCGMQVRTLSLEPSTRQTPSSASPMTFGLKEKACHALYFTKSSNNTWSISYNNRYVQSDTFRLEKGLKKPCFPPTTDGDPTAILISGVLNNLRFRKAFKNMSNTSVFEHAGRIFSAAENDNPNEIDLYSLDTLGTWNVDGGWKMAFTAHPKQMGTN
ncbi:uncharacterized protein LOC100830120 [Brachypodium distachyon]|uniref:uncharacterized protein LOC100830120 n=1 Tax=Brachypodium distachyon TaxID=15368 RepID=UPI000D0E2FD7|nr:uncharacterized protein LOC100830120 [Brachypodium distachyon]|eukprot:XP_024318392.1 uncharacterized protein LOC100830120 [Brachypodium distachyon]